MSSKLGDPDNLNDLGSREIMQAAGAATLASIAGSAFVMASPDFLERQRAAG